MHYISQYNSPVGKILLVADDKGLVKLCFENEKKEHYENENEIIKIAKKWLDIYFQGENPNFSPALNPKGTEFRHKVWEILIKIPYGETITYNDIAKKIAEERGIKKISAQAVGGAVGHNEIAIIIPCHRVIGANGNLTGYAGGLDKKCKLLELEGCDMHNFTMPKNNSPLK